ncbi:MAG: C-terminal binding protein [Dehalococcoidia bacterium]
MPRKVVMTMFRYPGIPADEDAYLKLGAGFAHQPCATEDEIVAAAGEAEAVITAMQPYSRGVIQRLPSLRLISVVGIGFEGVDVAAATEHGVLVANVPDYCQDEVSSHVLALILACNRKLIRIVDAVREGKWDSLEKPRIRHDIMPPLPRLRGQTLGLVGFGRIARTLTPKAQALGLRVLAHDPFVPRDTARDLGVELMELGELLGESDYVSVHAAQSADNMKLLGQKQFEQMKPTAFLINTARGGLVDEDALCAALSAGRIAGAALDVTDPEPPIPGSPLLDMENVILTAHTAQFSDEAMADLRRGVEENVFSVLRGEWPRGLVNPEARERYSQKWGSP